MSRRSRRQHEEHENHERWLVSYADFITLLFAFFVVMYSVSSVNDGKFRILSKSLDEAFVDAARSLTPIQVGEIVKSTMIEDDLVVDLKQSVADKGEKETEKSEEISRLVRISNQIEEVLAPYIQQDLINIKRDDLWVEVEMKSGLIFQSGRADLMERSEPFLKKIAEILRHTPNSIQVEGHTDNIPINTLEFPSNWELSAARAASVVHFLGTRGVNPKRMSAIGYGEHHPIDDNRIEKGRNRNRRVVLVLQSQSVSRHKWVSDERSKLLEAAKK